MWMLLTVPNANTALEILMPHTPLLSMLMLSFLIVACCCGKLQRSHAGRMLRSRHREDKAKKTPTPRSDNSEKKKVAERSPVDNCKTALVIQGTDEKIQKKEAAKPKPEKSNENNKRTMKVEEKPKAAKVYLDRTQNTDDKLNEADEKLDENSDDRHDKRKQSGEQEEGTLDGVVSIQNPTDEQQPAQKKRSTFVKTPAMK
ncbi:hypothetical protein Q1695_003328 [Nippostrongylus brasiliensis]|nr:hypothetical protein Q1695_003328 [Nippostrongylus brasiliensis]